MRFSKPFAVPLVGAALLPLPLSGAAFADVAKPSHPVTVKTPRPTHSAPTKTDESHGKQLSLSVSVNPELPPRAGIL